VNEADVPNAVLRKPECLAAAPSAPKLVAVKRKYSAKSGRRWAEIVRDAFVGALERYGLQAVHSVESIYRVDGGSAGVQVFFLVVLFQLHYSAAMTLLL
jgi:hypothetical protein